MSIVCINSKKAAKKTAIDLARQKADSAEAKLKVLKLAMDEIWAANVLADGPATDQTCTILRKAMIDAGIWEDEPGRFTSTERAARHFPATNLDKEDC